MSHSDRLDFFLKSRRDIRESMLISGVNDIGDKHSYANFSANFRKNLKMAPRGILMGPGTLIHEKNLKSKKSPQTSFKGKFFR